MVQVYNKIIGISIFIENEKPIEYILARLAEQAPGAFWHTASGRR